MRDFRSYVEEIYRHSVDIFSDILRYTKSLPRQNLIIWGGIAVFIVVLVIFFFIFHGKNISPETGIKITDFNAPKKDYFEWSTKIVTSQEEEGLREKMKERGQIQEMRLAFTENGFKKTDPIILRSSTMVQFELDTSDSGLPAESQLTISIPDAELHSLVTIPGRFRYLITFHKSGQQQIILTWKGLSEGKITKNITIQ